MVEVETSTAVMRLVQFSGMRQHSRAWLCTRYASYAGASDDVDTRWLTCLALKRPWLLAEAISAIQMAIFALIFAGDAICGAMKAGEPW